MKLPLPAFLAVPVFWSLCLLPTAAGEVDEPPKSFEKNKKFGFKDKEGSVVIDAIYDDARDFSEGLAAVNTGAKINYGGGHPAMWRSGGKWGYIDEKGKWVIPPTLEWGEPFSEGLAMARIGGGSVQFIDRSGKPVYTLADSENGGAFHEGLTPVRVDRSTDGEKDFQTKYIDKEGSVAFTVDGYAGNFQEGMAALSVKTGPKSDDSKYGYLDRTGKIVIVPQFAEALEFNEGLAAVRKVKTTGVYGMGDTWGYIDKTGKYVLKPLYNETHEFRNGVARVHTGGKLEQITFHQRPAWKGGEWQLIDRSGKVLKRSEEWVEYEDAPDKSTKAPK